MPDELDIPESLINLQRASVEEREKLSGLTGEDWDAQWKAWREAAERAAEAITEHAKESELNRYEVEKIVKRKALHPHLDS
ncbi:hypothetical protein ACX9I7_00940 [Streptomyces sp. L500]